MPKIGTFSCQNTFLSFSSTNNNLSISISLNTSLEVDVRVRVVLGLQLLLEFRLELVNSQRLDSGERGNGQRHSSPQTSSAHN